MDDPKPDPEGTTTSDDGVTSADVPSYLAHLYRGELDRATSWRGRLDQTVNWAVTIIAALLTWVFSSPDNPHYLLLIGMLAVALFHFVETRRYRAYDAWRARVRLIEADVFANALDPAEGVQHADWRAELGSDLRRPALKTPFLEAYARRLRRIYLPLLFVLLAAWIVRLTAFPRDSRPIAAAAIEGVPGTVVVVLVAVFYLGATGLAAWPIERRATGELRENGREGDWKTR